MTRRKDTRIAKITEESRKALEGDAGAPAFDRISMCLFFRQFAKPILNPLSPHQHYAGGVGILWTGAGKVLCKYNRRKMVAPAPPQRLCRCSTLSSYALLVGVVAHPSGNVRVMTGGMCNTPRTIGTQHVMYKVGNDAARMDGRM